MSDSNFVLAILSLAYVGVNICMSVFNYLDRNDDPCGDPEDVYTARCGSPISTFEFHAIEFTATFFFAVLQAFALLYTPKSLLNIFESPIVLKAVLFFAIVVSLIPTLLVWCNVSTFEVPAHEIEYSNELTMSFVDLVLLASLVRKHSSDGDVVNEPASGAASSNVIMASTALLVAVVQIVVYNSPFPSAERNAHYLEFTFECISAIITAWFCVDNKFVADKEIHEIMYGDHRDCAVCHSKSLEMSSVPSVQSRAASSPENSSSAPSSASKKNTCRKPGCSHLACA